MYCVTGRRDGQERPAAYFQNGNLHPTLLNTWVEFAAHCSLTVCAMQGAVRVAEKRAAAGPPVRFWRCGYFVLPRCTEIASSGDDVAEPVPASHVRRQVLLE